MVNGMGLKDLRGDGKVLEGLREKKISDLLRKRDDLNLLLINGSNGSGDANEEFRRMDDLVERHKTAIFRRKLINELVPRMADACCLGEEEVKAVLPHILPYETARLYMNLYSACHVEGYTCWFEITPKLIGRFTSSSSSELREMCQHIQKMQQRE